LIFGAGGQIGSELGPVLAESGAEVISLTRNDVDLSDSAALRASIRRISPDCIINAAAYTAVDKAESEPELAHAMNAIAPAVMAEEAHKLGAQLVHYSTDYVFDGRHGEPYEESDETAPLNVYGATKLAGDRAILASGARHLILRVGWVYSLHGKNFLLTVLRLARQGGPLRIVHDQIGVPDPAFWIAEMTQRALAGGLEGLYHLSPGGSTSWHGFATEVLRRFGHEQVEVQAISTAEYPTAAQRPAYSVLATAKLRRDLPVVLPEWTDLLDKVAGRSEITRGEFSAR
jgi:dTDP-4-dehydrorhamnose reductase